MIALQTRGAKLPDPSAQTAKFVSMMNMTKQQEAAERQAALAQQSMVLAQKKDAREEALQGPAVTKAEIDNIRAQIDDLEEQYKMVSTEEGHQFWLGRVRKIDPVIADQIGMYAPNFDREKVNNIMLTAKQAVDKIDPDAKATVEYAGKGGVDEQGRVIPEGTGIQVITGSKPSTRVIPSASASAPAPAAAPKTFVAPTAAPQTPAGDGGQLDAFQQDHVRRMKEGLGMTDTPASFTRGGMATPTAGQMSPDMVPAIIDSAVKTGVMAQIDLDQMLALAPPQARQGIMDVIRSNNVALQANAPSLAASAMGQQQPMAPNPVQRPQSQFADMRGPAPQASFADLGSAPPVQNTMAQYQPLQARNREVSPIPGIYSVPTGQVAATSQAQRETPGEVYAKEKARAKAQREALLEAGPKPLTVPQEAKLRDSITKDYKSARSTIDMMLNPVAGVVAAVNNVRKLSPDQKEAITGYSGYLPTMYASTKSADTAVKNLKGKVTEMGKSVAALTGAIGQMAVQEWRIVSDMIANLDLEGMGAADLDNQLDIIEAQARRAATVTRDAYENQYVEEFDRYPGRFRLPDASAFAAPAAKRRTPTKGAVDRNNPLLRN
jgi:hypothetical protein